MSRPYLKKQRRYERQEGRKQKKSHEVSADLITHHRFEEIITLLQGKSELTHRDRYLYGYSLLRTQRVVEALITLWPLVAAKGDYTALREECALLAAEVFKDEKNENNLFAMSLSEDALSTLFLIAKNVFAQTQRLSRITQRFFDFFWQQRHYEKLEHLLKSHRQDFSGTLIENLSKLAFFQFEKKMLNNLPAFVGHILTGGACLIAREPLYHSDIPEAVCLLAHEIKLLYSQLEIKHKQQLMWDKVLFENVVDMEAQVLIQVLQLAIKHNHTSSLEIVPTPSYLKHFDVNNKDVGQKFLPWLITTNSELVEMYQIDTQSAVLWALGGEQCFNMNTMVKLIHKNPKNTLHPYLLLAIQLRATVIKKPLLLKKIKEKGLVQLKHFKEGTMANLFKSILLQTVRSMIKKETNTYLTHYPPEFWQTLEEFYPVISEPDIANALIKKTIDRFYQQAAETGILNFNNLKKMAHQVKCDALEEQVERLCARQAGCSEFRLSVADKKKSGKVIKQIKDEPMLRTHLTWIADACQLLGRERSLTFFWHIHALFKNKKMNTILPLNGFLKQDNYCECDGCQRALYNDILPQVAAQFHLPVVHLFEKNVYFTLLASSQSSHTQTTTSVLSQADPFKVLNATLTDPKPIIMQKVMHLIKQSPKQMAILRQAQNELFIPAKRFLHHYFRYLAHEKNEKNENKKIEEAAHEPPFLLSKTISLDDIPFREAFLHADK